MKEIAAVILAGGKSSRMGQDKAFLNRNGKSFLQTIIEEVRKLGVTIYLSGEKEKLSAFRFPVIEDERADQGPVMALTSCFKRIKAEAILVVSCDVPEIKASELKRLIDLDNGEVDLTMFSSNDKELPLVALYKQSSFSAFFKASKSDERKLFNVIKPLKTQVIKYKGVLRNVNTPQDLERIK